MMAHARAAIWKTVVNLSAHKQINKHNIRESNHFAQFKNIHTTGYALHCCIIFFLI